ncbi:MAG TPA: SprT-like domain-containing protein [Haloplasmataceae bacterium]
MKSNEKNVVMIDNKSFNVIINRKNIKNTYIRVDDELNIIVNTNYFTDYKRIENLIIKNQNKIRKMINSKSKFNLSSDQIWYLGKIYHINCMYSDHYSYTINEQNIIFNTKYSLNETKDYFYKNEAEKILTERFLYCFANFINYKKISLPNIKIRKMEKRFGTCYYTKNLICLNTYLVKYDIEVIDYVIYHELSHFVFHNHSRAFYEFLSSISPKHEQLKKQLKNY